MILPSSDKLDTGHLQRLFDNMAECYKLFWFQAVVDTVMAGRNTASFDELINLMIADAWYMVTEYRLNLGPRDNLESLVHYAQSVTGLKSGEKRKNIIQTISACNDRRIVEYKRTLTNNVPYRLQAPFLPLMKGSAWDGSQLVVANRINSVEKLIYRFESINGLDSLISIDESWAEYLKANYEIISGWIKYNLITYLQRRNPGVPGIPNKLAPPQERNLAKVQKLWNAVMEAVPVYDIYGNEELNGNPFSIYHFVPWSYVTHDELWNLNPTTKSINSSKSNCLPDWDMYFTRLCRMEYMPYSICGTNYQMVELYRKCLDEHVNSEDVRRRLYKPGLEFNDFASVLEEIIRPVYVAAQNLGFDTWRYSI